MKTDLSMVKDMLSNVQNSQERVSSNQGELQQTLRVLQIEDSGIRNELGQLSADVNRRLNYKEDKISDHSKAGFSIGNKIGGQGNFPGEIRIGMKS